MSTTTHTVPEYGPVIEGESILNGEQEVLTSPYDGKPIAAVYQSSAAVVDQAIAAARAAAPKMAALSNFQRSELLEKVAQLLRRDRTEFASLLNAETGKPIREATAEVDRGLQTLAASASAARELRGEVVPLDAAPI